MMRSRNQVARGTVSAVSLPIDRGESDGVSCIGEVLVEKGEGRALARGAVDGGKADGVGPQGPHLRRELHDSVRKGSATYK